MRTTPRATVPAAPTISEESKQPPTPPPKQPPTPISGTAKLRMGAAKAVKAAPRMVSILDMVAMTEGRLADLMVSSPRRRKAVLAHNYLREKAQGSRDILRWFRGLLGKSGTIPRFGAWDDKFKQEMRARAPMYFENPALLLGIIEFLPVLAPPNAGWSPDRVYQAACAFIGVLAFADIFREYLEEVSSAPQSAD